MKIIDDLNEHQLASTLEDAMHQFSAGAPIGLVVPLAIMNRTLGTLRADLADEDNAKLSPELRARARVAVDAHVKDLGEQYEHLRRVVQRMYPDPAR
jgi:hypothetical protein